MDEADVRVLDAQPKFSDFLDSPDGSGNYAEAIRLMMEAEEV